MCLKPKKIYIQGTRKEDSYNGKKGEKYDIETFVKCGKCSECQNEKANNWVIRNEYEKRKWNKICFITLTYKDNPVFLIKKDLQDFIKRLRRQIEYHDLNNGEKIRYFACGEYGETKGRPHYHIIIYNWEDKNAKFTRFNKKTNAIFKSELIEKTWGKGLTSYQKFNEKEIPYISLYTNVNERIAKAYKCSVAKAKEMIEMLKKDKQDNTRIAKITTLNKHIKKAEEQKSEYIKICEFNTWSKALGKEEFIKNFDLVKNYVFTEYVNEKEFITPTPWVKQLAKKGNVQCINEMRKREEMAKMQRLNEESLTIINNLKKIYETPKKAIEYVDKKSKSENEF